MPGPRPAIVELDSAISELFYTIRQKLPEFLPPWLPWKAFEDRTNYVKAVQILFHEILADSLVWTPASQRSGRTETRYFKRKDGSVYEMDLDITVLAVLNVWDLEKLFVDEGLFEEFDKFLTAFEPDFNDFIFKSIQDQIAQVVRGFRQHAWHATQIGTAYILHPGGIMLDMERLVREYGSEAGPVEVDVLAHWSVVDEPTASLSPEMEKANQVINEELRKLGIDRESWEVANRLSISASAGTPLSKRDRQLLQYREDNYQGPAAAGPTLPEQFATKEADAWKAPVVDPARKKPGRHIEGTAKRKGATHGTVNASRSNAQRRHSTAAQ